MQYKFNRKFDSYGAVYRAFVVALRASTITPKNLTAEGCRAGQAFCNRFLLPDVAFAEIFYEEDTAKAVALAWAHADAWNKLDLHNVPSYEAGLQKLLELSGDDRMKAWIGHCAYLQGVPIDSQDHWRMVVEKAGWVIIAAVSNIPGTHVRFALEHQRGPKW